MTIWDEVDLTDASDRQKASFWRTELERELEDVDVLGLHPSLLPVLADVRGVIGPETYKMLETGPKSPRWRLIEHGRMVAQNYRQALRQIEEQIRNASNGQIIRYAERYYNRPR